MFWLLEKLWWLLSGVESAKTAAAIVVCGVIGILASWQITKSYAGDLKQNIMTESQRNIDYTDLRAGSNAEHIGRVYEGLARIEKKLDEGQKEQTKRQDRMFELLNQRGK